MTRRPQLIEDIDSLKTKDVNLQSNIEGLQAISLYSKILLDNKDLDTVIIPGVYIINNCTHSDGVQYGTLTVKKACSGDTDVYYIEQHLVDNTNSRSRTRAREEHGIWRDWNCDSAKIDVLNGQVKNALGEYLQTTITDVFNLPIGKWFGVDLTNSPRDGYLYYDIIGGDNPKFRKIISKSFFINQTWENTKSNDVWLGWEDKSGSTRVTKPDEKVIDKPINTNVRTCFETGIYRSERWVGYPGDGLPNGQGILVVMNYSGDCQTGWVEHEFITPHKNTRYVGVYIKGTWSGWDKMVTSRKTDIKFPFNTGYDYASNMYLSQIFKNSLSEATIYCSVQRTDGNKFLANTKVNVGTLPEGYINLTSTQVFGSCCDINMDPVDKGFSIVSLYDGKISVNPNVACKNIIFELKYEVK